MLEMVRTDLGQGAAQAIEDACALGVVIPLGTPAEEVPRRLELWQRIRKDRACKVVEDTRRRGSEVDESHTSPETSKCAFHTSLHDTTTSCDIVC